MNRFLFCFSVLLLLTCAARSPVVEESYGASFNTNEVVQSEQLLTAYSESQLIDTVRTVLRGTVNEVCQAKGCWMTMAAGKQEDLMVKFKDYGFFVPKNIGDREVILSGIAYYQLTPVEDLRHYAKDAGKTEDEIAAITDARKELHFLADGVQLISMPGLPGSDR